MTIARVTIASTMLPCGLHRRHAPSPAYCELHHIVPQAWQAVFAPPEPWPFPGHGSDGRRLWDARTAALCPTGHRNVHWWLVRAMRSHAADGGDGSAGALDTAFAEATFGVRRKVRAEVAMARQAMERFVAAGGSLQTLAAASQWGIA